MPPAYVENMHETLTYWAPTGNTASGGTTFAAPVEISGRWQEKQDLFRDRNGIEQVSQAIAYVDRELADRGWLFRGASVATDPTAVVGATEIRAVQQSPALGNEYTLHKVIL